MFHKEGHKIIFLTFAVSAIAIFLIDYLISIQWLKILLQLAFLVFLVLILQFFRNPKRHTKPNDHHILSLFEKCWKLIQVIGTD